MSCGKGDNWIETIAGHSQANYRWKEPGVRFKRILFPCLNRLFLRADKKENESYRDTGKQPKNVLGGIQQEETAGKNGGTCQCNGSVYPVCGKCFCNLFADNCCSH